MINFHLIKLFAILLSVLLAVWAVPAYLIVANVQPIYILILLLIIVLLHVVMARLQTQPQCYASYVIQSVITAQQLQQHAQTA